MAYAPNTYTTNGTDRDYNITFPFLRESDIRVTVFDASGNLLTDSADYDFSIQKPDATFQVRVVQNGTINNNDGGTALASGSTVTISRVTDISTLVTVFQDGASLRASDINALISQINYALEEFGDNTTSALGKNITQTAWDATSLRITNLAQPTADNDAIRKVDVDSGIGPDITTVAGIASDVTTLGSGTDTSGRLHRLNIEDVADDLNLGANSDITTVATDIRTGGNNHVQAVSNSIADVNTLAGNDTDGTAHLVNIETVAEDLAGSNTIGTVAGIASAVSSVAADAADIGVVAADIQVGGPDTIGTVAGIASAVSNVSSISAAVTSVNDNSTNINTVAGDTSAINTLATGTDSGGTAYLTHLENASTNAAAAQAALTAFNRTYLGAYSADPTVDGNGDALTDGDLYYNTTDEVLKFYNDTDDAWVTLNNSVQVNAATTLGAVGDANFGTLLENDFIVRDGSNPAKWVNKTPAQARTSLGLGTAAVAATGDFATAAQGATADAAVQPNTTPEFAGLGVGTDTPDTIVEVRAADPIVTIRDTETGVASSSSTLQFAESGGGDTLGSYYDIGLLAGELSIREGATERFLLEGNNSANPGRMSFRAYGNGTHTGTAAKSLSVDSSGNVIEEQDVSSTATPSFGTLTATRGTYPAVNVHETGQAGQGQFAQSGADVQLRNTGNGALAFFTNNTSRMRIAPNGNVGIGTNSVAANLHVMRDDSGEGALLQLENDGTGDANITFVRTGIRAYAVGIDGTDNSFRIATSAGLGTDTALSIDTSGEVKTLNSGNMVSVRQADVRTTTGTHTLVGGATLYYANAAATYNTSGLTPGDIVTIYNEGGGTVTVNTGGTVELYKDGEASAVTAAVAIGADTIATVTCVSATKAIIAGSDLT